MKTKQCPKCKGLGGYPKCGACQNKLVVKDEANDRLPRTACSPSSFPAMPLDAALEFAESGESTGGIMTHEAPQNP